MDERDERKQTSDEASEYVRATPQGRARLIQSILLAVSTLVVLRAVAGTHDARCAG
jgi:hypothetical protein